MQGIPPKFISRMGSKGMNILADKLTLAEYLSEQFNLIILLEIVRQTVNTILRTPDIMYRHHHILF